MPSTLRELRQEAGFRTAREFAQEAGIPAATYARYESSPGKIPLERAWELADRLGCSIDAVVGREHVDVASMRGDAQKAYDALSPDSRALVDEFMEFARARDERAAERRAAAEKRRWRMAMGRLEDAYLRGLPAGAAFSSAAELREGFRAYVESAAESAGAGGGAASAVMAAYDGEHAAELESGSYVYEAIDLPRTGGVDR